MSKTNKILAGLLVVQLLLTGYFYRDNRQQSSPEVELLAGLTADQVRKMVISETGQQSLVLLRDDEGWQVELAAGRKYPADQTKLEALLERLVGLKSARLVSRTKESQKRLKVADDQYNRKVELASGSGSRTLFLGTAPSYQSIHVRAGESDQVYLVDDLALWEVPAEAAGWWQSLILDQNPEQLLGVELINQQGSLRLQRNTVEEPWRLNEGESEPDAGKTGDFLAGISRLSINQVVVDPAWRPDGKPAATLKLRSADREAELQVWPRPDEDSDYPVKVFGSDFYGQAGSYAVEEILNAKPEALLPDREREEGAPEKLPGETI
jgi:hypothetical protein